VEVRTYPIGQLLLTIPDYPLQANPFGRKAEDASENPPAGAQPSPALMTLDAAEKGVMLVKTIEGAIDTGSWRENGGLGSAQILGSSLIVTQTEANQKQVEKLLAGLRQDASSNAMVEVDARWVMLTAEQLDAWQAAPANKIAAVVGEILKDKEAQYCQGRLIGFNGQTVSILSAQTATIVTGMTPIVSTGVAAYSVETQPERSGVSLQVTPRIAVDRDAIVVDVHSKVVERRSRDRAPMTEIPTTQRAEGVQLPDAENLTKMIHDAGQPDRLNEEFNTTVSLTPGVPLIIGGMTRLPGGSDTRQLCLVLTARVPAGRTPAATK
jgi:type II secretory pathway component GspD/PulD (secretin)